MSKIIFDVFGIIYLYVPQFQLSIVCKSHIVIKIFRNKYTHAKFIYTYILI